MVNNIKAILLFAGESKRMGKLKPLLSIGEKTVVEAVLNEYHASSLSEVVLVLGYRADDVKKTINEKISSNKLKVVVNKGFKKEMFSSIQTGLLEIKDAEGILIGLGDQVLITCDIINELTESYVKGKVLIPTFQRRKGHPVIIPYTMRNEILAMDAEKTTLKDVLSRHRDIINFLEMKSDKVLIDMDTKEEYERIKAIWKK
ncbi:MAG: nucleotidyltransferase family protein [Caldisericota bacterium]|nr:nucleotidyltransferase family protein [Caldisericota bacterium]